MPIIQARKRQTMAEPVPAAELVRETGGMTKPLAVKWAYRYHRLTFDYYDSLEDAVSAAAWASDDGEEALDSFEVWDEDGYRRIEHDEAHRLIAEHSTRRYEAEKAASEARVYVGELWVTNPDGEEVLWSPFTSLERAHEVMAQLAPMGHRARLKMLPTPEQSDGDA